ncbi:transcriptional regulator [Leptospira wolffii]|uniref:Transcriptional regulator n=1 Tax=Leptospira wolffii TaxID=409998 RepID=A0A2M9Z908_9LEPT|nr:helix-turn-helix domain-containing protein [Leptospira wolffii]PJZ64874.1 transcriptional regulator [Leptospira wolffii]TGK58213.1 transcriptional regulator [Leptospira wolffii]TGK66411.1 transcriptional regulator [Leptospira wolffii]TGK68891.1 transcriptional regulator [Leptospira wolffii]TGL27243.1 transcriptional regulator [Leptospira wolffii]
MAKSPQVSPLSLCTQHDGSAVRELLTRIADKWSIFLIVTLAKSPQKKARFSELKNNIPGISQRMLTTTLRNLERDGMLTRQIFAEIPPRVEYELTPLGLSLLLPMQSLINWVSENWSEVNRARDKYDKKK